MTTVDPDSRDVESEVLGVAWHLSERIAGGPGHGRSEGGELDDGPSARTAAELGQLPRDERDALPPLWRRVLTGQSFAWRIRRVQHFLLRQRRRFARALLRWMRAHPEVRRSLASGQMMDALRAVKDLRAPAARTALHRSLPVIWTDIGSCALADDHLLRRHVDLRPLSEATTLDSAIGKGGVGHLEAGVDGCVRCVSAAGQTEAEILGPIDAQDWNPVGFPQRPSAGTIRLDGLLDETDPKVLRRRLADARRAGSVQCHVAENTDAVAAARAILELAASGVPLTHGRLPEPVRRLLSPGLAELIDSTYTSDLQSERARELHSICVRREALTHFSARGRWSHIGSVLESGVRSTPAVSVLLPSNRRKDVVDAARQVASQRGVEVQLLVGLHGAHMPVELAAELEQAFPGDLVVERLADELNLGEVLNVLTGLADRPLVAKWDDDDWYAPDHLADLVLAREYSGARLVAKAAEFIYLEALDLTMRRFAIGAEHVSSTVAGGTLLLDTDDLQGLGWAEVPRQVDRRLIEAMADYGLPCYRTHGFGYILRRRGHELRGHTWHADDAYFLRQSVEQRPGLDLEFAGVCESSS